MKIRAMRQDNRCTNLPPGEVYFSQPLKNNAPKELKTILGSCVAVIVWHAKSKTAGMCHYLLVQEAEKSKSSQVIQTYRYGEQALDYLLKRMASLHPLEEYELALYGGSNMYPSVTYPSIGKVNVMFAKNWAKKNKLTFCQQDTLGHHGRSVTLELTTGGITVIKYKDDKGGFSEHSSNDS
ncbi:chemotaxis protein CheD [Colwellia sp. MT41]|uniref:chemotaxis protein CheD n=1 Tax=Colwellia sp. MT41 TaxID=58049 RepID=UPI000A4BC251|nr:chemotaxis protein CheD [Colwellia sp. MT41]